MSRSAGVWGSGINIRHDGNEGVVVEYLFRIGGCISLVAYLDSVVTDQRQVSSLSIAGFLGDLHEEKMLSICGSYGPEASSMANY